MRRDTEILCVVEELKGTFLGRFWEWFAYISGQLVLNLCTFVPYLLFKLRYVTVPS
jgi:hypothetical protein